MPQETPKSTTAVTETPKAAPKFTLVGNSIDDLVIELAKTVLETGGAFTIQDNKSANGNKYAIWNLDDGLGTNPMNPGLGLSPEQARRLPTQAGVPSILSCKLMLRQLTVPSAIAAKAAERVAATAARESKLEQELAAIRARRAEVK